MSPSTKRRQRSSVKKQLAGSAEAVFIRSARRPSERWRLPVGADGKLTATPIIRSRPPLCVGARGSGYVSGEITFRRTVAESPM
jgi:hypothetical protein